MPTKKPPCRLVHRMVAGGSSARIRHPADARLAFAHAFQRRIEQHQEEQREQVRPRQPVNRGRGGRDHGDSQSPPSGSTLRRTSGNSSGEGDATAAACANSTTARKSAHARSARRTARRTATPTRTRRRPAWRRKRCRARGPSALARIHSPVRMCQPVSQSPSSVFTPSMRPNRNAMGMRKAKSVSDGRNLIANWDRRASIIALHAIQELATGCRASNARIRSWNERKSI